MRAAGCAEVTGSRSLISVFVGRRMHNALRIPLTLAVRTYVR
jgi:hypothetical protein